MNWDNFIEFNKVKMKIEDIIDSEVEPKNCDSLSNARLLAILSSIVIEIFLAYAGDYIYTCGFGWLDGILILIPNSVCIFLNLKFCKINKKIGWIAVFIGCTWNLFFGLMLHSVIC